VQGFTEPDPRDDLNGLDVARKVVILARECGLEVELTDVAIESLVPKELTALKTADEYLAQVILLFHCCHTLYYCRSAVTTVFFKTKRNLFFLIFLIFIYSSVTLS
jgi:homoserine dehydrogenase